MNKPPILYATLPIGARFTIQYEWPAVEYIKISARLAVPIDQHGNAQQTSAAKQMGHNPAVLPIEEEEV